MKSSWFLVLPILFFSVSSPAQSAQGPDKKEMEQIYRDANLGNPRAQLYLGSLYGNGKGVLLDHTEAAKWYRKAAEQGYAKAQWYLGLAYYNGAGLPRDYAEAVKWHRKAADQGLAEAQIEMGNMFYYGKGVPLDHAEAANWYRKAAEQGNAKAKDYLQRTFNAGRVNPYGLGEAMETILKALLLPLVYFPFWGPFACFYVAKAIARRVIERSSDMDPVLAASAAVLAASAAQLALFTPVSAFSRGGNVGVIVPWWAGFIFEVSEPGARIGDISIGSFLLSLLLSIPISIFATSRARRQSGS